MIKIPQKLFIQITEECNLKCVLCDYWKRKDPDTKIDTDDKIVFLYETIKWLKSQDKNFHKNFRVILTGGEPFLYPEEVFAISEMCLLNNIQCDVNTNGLLFGKTVTYFDVFYSGLKVTFSIDSHSSEIHDRLRRKQGLFKDVVKNIKILLDNRNDYPNPIKIWVQSILGEWNLRYIPEHLEFFINLGVDGLLFQPLQYTFGIKPPKLWYKDFYGFPKGTSIIFDSLKWLSSYKEFGDNKDFIINSEQEIKSWNIYFDNPELLNDLALKYVNCKAPEQNILIDVEGDVSFCGWHFPEPKDKIGNIRDKGIKELWDGEVARKEKLKLKKCNKGCATAMCNIDWSLRKD